MFLVFFLFLFVAHFNLLILVTFGNLRLLRRRVSFFCFFLLLLSFLRFCFFFAPFRQELTLIFLNLSHALVVLLVLVATESLAALDAREVPGILALARAVSLDLLFLQNSVQLAKQSL